MRMLFALALFSPGTVAPTAATEPAPDSAAVPTSASGEEATQDPVLAKASELYAAGRVRFEVGDFDGAIELWTESYATVAKRQDADQILAAVSYNLALAQHKAFEIDRDLRRLRKAVQMLDQSVGLYEQIGSQDLPAMTAQRDAFRIQLTDAEAAEAAALADARTPAETQESPNAKSGPRGLLIGGAVAAGLGIGALGLMGFGLARGASQRDGLDDPALSLDERRTRLDAGYRSNTIAIAGGVSGGILLAAGVAMIVLDRRRAKADSATARLGLRPGPGEFGVAVGGQF